MKIYRALTVVALAAPVAVHAGPPPAARMPPQMVRSVLPPGPVMGTGVNPGVVPGPAPGTGINPGVVPGPAPGTVINPGTIINPGGLPGTVHGTMINPGSGGGHGHERGNEHHSSPPSTDSGSGG